ncbi:MAG: conjugal transfer protein TraF [Pseudomonadota bacterium]
MRILTKCYVLILLIALITCPTAASAREWSIVGPRALGMGGANVAVANDVTASYWNPAAYGFFSKEGGGDYSKRDWSATVNAGVGASIHEELGEKLDEISEYDFDVLDEGQIQAQDVDDYVQLLSALKAFDENENRAAKVSAEAQFGVQVGHLGVGGMVLAEISAKGDIDTVNIIPDTGVVGGNIITYLGTPANFSTANNVTNDYLPLSTYNNLIATIGALPGWNPGDAADFVDAVDNGLAAANAAGQTIPADIDTDILNVAKLASDAGTGDSFEDNESALIFKGIAVTEVPVTYGYAITEDLAIGGNLKYMKARTYNVAVKIFDNDFEDALDDAQDDYEESTNFGVDLGLLYRFGDDLRVGLVGRNLNSPKFDMKKLLPSDDGSIEEEPQLRAGVCYKPVSFLILAADCDLTKNDTTISGSYKSQNVSLGAELNLIEFLRLRVGAYKNIAESDIGWVYTAGFGLNFWLFNLDAGAAMASESETIDEDEIPKEVRAEVALSMLF